MISWHRNSCGRPDVCLVDGMPFCMSCDSLAPLDDLSPSQVPSNPSVLYHETKGLSLHWPTSVNYETHCYDSNGCDISSQIADILGTKPKDEETSRQPTERHRSVHANNRVSSHEPLSEGQGSGQGEINPPSPNPQDSLVGSDSIRILHLSGGNESDPLHGHLELYLGRDWSVLPITVNCEAALRALRLPDADRRIWVDAICINQDNDIERTHQVQFMPVIYATATQVVIYIDNERKQMGIGGTYYGTVTRSQWETNWKKMDRRLQRPYFFRSWIIQEIAAARKAWVTDRSSWQPWPIVDAHAEGQASRTFLPWIKDFEKRKYRLPVHLVKLVMDSWSSQASDPRDKIFALLGYTGLAAFALTKHGEVNILRYASGYTKSRNLPSWVSDWDLLSRDWEIMLRMEHVELHSVARPDECIQYPWQLRRWGEDRWLRNRIDVTSDEIDVPKATTVPGPTGTLCVQGTRLTSLTKKFKRNHFSTHAVFWGDFFSITVPHNSQFDDCIFSLRGFDVPVALRPVRKNAEHGLPRKDLFTFVGLCYVASANLITLQGSHHRADVPDDLAQTSQWTVLQGSSGFLGGLRTENTQALHLKLAEMYSAPGMDFPARHIAFFEDLQRRVKSIWDDILCRYGKDAFPLTPGRGILTELQDAFAGQALGEDMRLLSVIRKVAEAKTGFNVSISEELDFLAKNRLLYLQKLSIRQQEEGDRYCPRWYDFAGISSYWYNMRYIHTDKAAGYIEQALAYMDIAHTEKSNTAASVLSANIDAATEYRRATRIASIEVELTAKSLVLPMFETDPEETMDDWQKIFII
ncbi:heterokaryon incompatibility protein-domain-containing protein [Pseudoneurospora amorphoporcata]|uniref:Heterokaryon incompatibility protein-domain-containing protein n=1 Tax=Pseudoneurospora amorphoporcata TaxID=241081 RepID=A0AAN6NNE2_9PEZI|nr:heterokaryon incompatibility protein-domain-containing protein [Pseudoneurospora amorphoporcata]